MTHIGDPNLCLSSPSSFAHSSILSSYVNILRTYASNTPFLNHCVIRMFYRICVECQHPGMLFQMSLFRILQKFHRDPMAKSTQLTVREFISTSIRFVDFIGIISIRYVVITEVLHCSPNESIHLCWVTLLERSKHRGWDARWISTTDGQKPRREVIISDGLKKDSSMLIM